MIILFPVDIPCLRDQRILIGLDETPRIDLVPMLRSLVDNRGLLELGYEDPSRHRLRATYRSKVEKAADHRWPSKFPGDRKGLLHRVAG